MPKHTLFVCKSCHCSTDKRPEHQPADGARLLEQLSTLGNDQVQADCLEIHSVGCLWTCGEPCAVAFSAPHKPTYLFTALPTSETAPALLQFGHLYLSSTTGDIPWKQFPIVLQSASIAKVPAARDGV
ncbi:hypothetical protein C7293_17725 [filamentous cyanobacterium CCT1]|nr:hypothetical protein C7293_17725 [filamentous cyanobacterium CCT1]PSN79373.1 hypothetical protein C8B47_12075 [filamentous cyanobacterium CCP4]